jgi:hypothetical protein
MTSRRVVRITQLFFNRLDQLLEAHRSNDGRPSATDFLLHDLPPIIEALANGFDVVTTAIPHRKRVRVLISHGMLVGHLAVYVALDADGSVDVLYLDIDGFQSGLS